MEKGTPFKVYHDEEGNTPRQGADDETRARIIEPRIELRPRRGLLRIGSTEIGQGGLGVRTHPRRPVGDVSNDQNLKNQSSAAQPRTNARRDEEINGRQNEVRNIEMIDLTEESDLSEEKIRLGDVVETLLKTKGLDPENNVGMEKQEKEKLCKALLELIEENAKFDNELHQKVKRIKKERTTDKIDKERDNIKKYEVKRLNNKKMYILRHEQLREKNDFTDSLGLSKVVDENVTEECINKTKEILTENAIEFSATSKNESYTGVAKGNCVGTDFQHEVNTDVFEANNTRNNGDEHDAYDELNESNGNNAFPEVNNMNFENMNEIDRHDLDNIDMNGSFIMKTGISPAMGLIGGLLPVNVLQAPLIPEHIWMLQALMNKNYDLSIGENPPVIHVENFVIISNDRMSWKCLNCAYAMIFENINELSSYTVHHLHLVGLLREIPLMKCPGCGVMPFETGLVDICKSCTEVYLGHWKEVQGGCIFDAVPVKP